MNMHSTLRLSVLMLCLAGIEKIPANVPTGQVTSEWGIGAGMYSPYSNRAYNDNYFPNEINQYNEYYYNPYYYNPQYYNSGYNSSDYKPGFNNTGDGYYSPGFYKDLYKSSRDSYYLPDR